ncbi:hypothetical protein IPV69_02085 [Humisphaera borealis]|uniref:ARG and Rhodanese-Phosphatase-superfamily-associated domain-containing protein n=2 Tax=Humisphaera borealis TaxID=2807512 RepID=A0A7M2WXG2_9BACT|nr:hypothetical protein IPV69_02085 [Humisphaera borealis]
MHDAYADNRQQLHDLRNSFTLPDEAIGMAMFLGGEFQGADLFDRHSTLQHFWSSLLDSYLIGFLNVQSEEAAEPSPDAIAKVLDEVTKAAWESFTPPGAGLEWRTETDAYSGSALVWNDESVIHMQVFPKSTEPAEPRGLRPRRR